MIYIEEAIEKFNNFPPIVQLEFGSNMFMGKVRKIEEKYKIDLSSLIIFVAVDELKGEEIINYLKREFELEKEIAEEIKKDLDELIFNPIVRRLNFLNSDPDKQFLLLEEKNVAEEIFKQGLVNELNNHFIIIKAVNARFFYILANDFNFKKELENALYINQEKLTHKEFIFDGKPHSPSIGNWLKDFIKKNGSQMFNNLVLAEYLINSDNAKKLETKEKELLKKLLLLYRNIKFFPESMPTDTGEGWEIIPIDEVEEKEIKSEINENSAQIAKKNEVDDLIKKAIQYPVSSLERKAIEEELDKLGT
ncbi:hypothetical protein KKC67_00595 [Patescibacteria group bacterium]|nr:hypothetical protein [Patescibacteria group bacterium]MBU0879515.1 hypothetical protein [Patescibacteria group bacterium]MBU0879900.1 hypothetical protein [Patescibacteria group bacterium]MBU1062723.1 hypothetical protein [Patescibacteria group bacterium]MBU1783436.1 hypothetical protein [Patescibacteria group bacterium]